jgi:type I restriction enzyme S subunit
MRRYDSYKDSGVEWIGEIPTEWGIKRLKNVSDVKPSNVDKHIFPDEIQVRLCNYTDVYYNDFITNSTELKNGSCTTDEFEKFKISKGDVIITKDSESPDDIGIPTLVKDNFEDVVCGYHLTLIKPQTINGGFIFRFIQSDRTRRYFEIHSNGITRYGLGKSSIENLFLPYPPLPEQQQIVSYLDTKTSLIDSLIEKTKLKIQLLKENRTSLINEVVTKGLNPNVEMKDSGVEWIGEIPSHYQIGKLKHLCKENQRSLSNSTDPNYELNYIEISDVNSEGVIGNTTPYIFSESPSRCRRIVQKGDVIVSTVRTYLKSIGLIENEVEDLICSTGFSVLTPNSGINSKYLFYLLRTEWFISMVISKSEGVSYPSIQSEKLVNIDVVFCELMEQNQIVSYLDEHTQLIDKTISVEERRIELLKEYRQSLISEVVTGKRKVVTYE